MKHLWSPWRKKYIEKEEKEDGCVFCNAQAKQDSPENLIIARGKFTFAILNKYPYTSGHMMITPFAHSATLEELNPAIRAELMEMISKCNQVLKKVYNPEAFNVGANIGEAAGAGIPGHIHFHIVPRWKGDTNFMSAIGEVRVLPETLEQTHQRVADAWQKI